MPGNPLGQAPLERAGLVDLAKRAQDFGRDWFRNGAVPSQVLYSDEELTGDQADDILAKVMSRWRKRQPAVLGTGLKLEQVSVKADESQFLNTMRQAAAEIALCFNMHPDKIAAAVSGSAVTYANREQNQQDMLDDSMNPELVVVQEVFTQKVLRPGEWVMFNTAALLRSDLAARMAAYASGIQSEVLVPNDGRAREALAPLPGGDISRGAVEKVGVLVRAGFDPESALAALGLPPIVHTGLVPITVQGEAVSLGKVP
jgi:HK97 family phage portal protein